MRNLRRIVLGAAAIGMVWSAPASAQNAELEAETLQKLDIMLMVTHLRCRLGEDGFESEYRAYAERHKDTMNRAGQDLHAYYALRHGAERAQRHIDSLGTGMANSYGRGHPWLSCIQLKEVAADLADTPSRAQLLSAAHELLEDRPRTDNLLASYR